MNLITELQKIYPENTISVKERYIKDIRTVPDPEFKPKDKEDKTKPSLIQEDNSLRTYNIVFDGVETDAQLWINVKYQEFDLLSNVGKSSVDLTKRKIEEWKTLFEGLDLLEEELAVRLEENTPEYH